MSAAVSRSLHSVAEYLDSERTAPSKSEFHDGRISAMAGGTASHSQLAAAFTRELGNFAKLRGCFIFNSEMKLRISEENRVLYPDVSGLCGRPEYLDERRDVLLNPSFIVEVLSKSTEAYDRGRKLTLYMARPSVVEIALASAVEVRVDKYTRQPDGIWRFDIHAGPESTVPFTSLGCELALRDVYAGVELDPIEPDPV